MSTHTERKLLTKISFSDDVPQQQKVNARTQLDAIVDARPLFHLDVNPLLFMWFSNFCAVSLKYLEKLNFDEN